ncbi:MAG: hypothetical protein ACI9WS_000848 [Paraglaciecola psychrophila]|jgi:hypothetical protein
MPANRNVALLTFVVTLILYFINHYTLQPPSVVPASAGELQFSGERGHRLLATLLAGDKPHPVGSAQNKLVKQRIMQRLDELAISYTEQRTWACAERVNSCALVENIIATIDGQQDHNYIALMAHYDSTPMAIGAGDDGAGVAALLESARILKAQAPFQQPILLLFTDAEEVGLLGAEGFFQQHPLAKKIGFLLNVEGSGTSGPSLVLRTQGPNETLIDLFAASASRPVGFSMNTEIFKRMPNDTDFSVAQRAGIAGIDFAFAGERNHYHTLNDSVENLDVRVIQHHGDNILGLTQGLANADLQQLGGTLVYMTAYGQLIAWSQLNNVYLLLLAAVALGLAAYRLQARVPGVLLALVVAVAIVLLSAAAGFATFELIGVIQGSVVSWPAAPVGHRVALLFSTMLGALCVAAISNRWLAWVDLTIGVWLLWLLLSTALVIYMPAAAIQLLAATLLATVLIALLSFAPERFRRILLLPSLLLIVPSTLGVVLLLEQSQGYRLVVAVLPFLALYMCAVAPLIHGVKLKLPIIGSAAIMLLAIITAGTSVLYSDWRPQTLNIKYYQNTDDNTAFYHLESANPLPATMMSSMDFSIEPKALLPATSATMTPSASVTPVDIAAPVMTLLTEQHSASSRTLLFQLLSPRAASAIALVLPLSAKLDRFSLDGREFAAKLITRGPYSGHYGVFLNGVFDRSVQLQLQLASTEPVTAVIYDVSTELPAEGAKLQQLRAPLGIAVHRGDRAFAVKQVSF